MKTFLSAILVFVLMLSGIAYSIFYVSNISEELQEDIISISKTAQAENWNECDISIKRFENEWNKNEKILYFFTDHKNIDEVRSVVEKIKVCVFYHNAEETVVHTSILYMLVEYIKENELPLAENIL